MSSGDDDEEDRRVPRGSDLSVPTIHGSKELGRSRSSLKRERVGNETALRELADELVALAPKRWEQLSISQDAIDKLADAKRIKSYTAKDRQLRTVRAALRASDWVQVRLRLDQFNAGYTISPVGEGTNESQKWSEALLVQGESGLARFLEEYPNADRQRLRQLVRNVIKSPNKRGKTRLQLDRAVVQYVEEANSMEGT